MRAAAHRARDRHLAEIPISDPDAIVRALGGSFRRLEEYKLRDGSTVTTLLGANRHEAAIYSRQGRITHRVRIFSPRVSLVKEG